MNMKRNHKAKIMVVSTAVAGLSIFLLAGWTGSAAPAAEWESTGGAAEIYAASCAKCHGSDGRANTAKGRKLEATDFTGDWNRDEARGIRIITNGKGDMPSFKNKLTAAQIRAVFGYVRGFGR
jgi:cytochrome c oxidase cbb3-type subunit 3